MIEVIDGLGVIASSPEIDGELEDVGDVDACIGMKDVVDSVQDLGVGFPGHAEGRDVFDQRVGAASALVMEFRQGELHLARKFVFAFGADTDCTANGSGSPR